MEHKSRVNVLKSYIFQLILTPVVINLVKLKRDYWYYFYHMVKNNDKTM